MTPNAEKIPTSRARTADRFRFAEASLRGTQADRDRGDAREDRRPERVPPGIRLRLDRDLL